MYYRLKPEYVLRGWDKLAWTLVRRPENDMKVLRREEFEALLLCDGTMDSHEEVFTSEIKDIINRYEKENIIEKCGNRSELMEEQFYRYYNNRFVRTAFWSVTGRCNFHCRHCYMDAPGETLGEVSHKQAIDFIDQMAECGILQVILTGGEPFVRKDFWSLVDRIQFHRMAIRQIYTNGWMLDEAVLDEFEKRNLRPEFSVSFDGIGWHDWMRGVPGAEESAVRALRLCVERGFRTNVEMCIHRGNQDSLRDTVRELAGIGVPMIKVGSIMLTDLWKRNSEGNALDIREYTEAMLRYIPFFFRDNMPMEVMLSGVVRLHKGSGEYQILPEKWTGKGENEDRHLCGAARYACYITPEGRLLPCMPMTACKEQELFPLVQDIGLKKGLSDSFYMDIVDSRIKDLLAANPRCRACAHKYQCGGGCRAIALDQTGDLMGCDDMQCILWNEGYVDRIRKTVEDAIDVSGTERNS